MKHFLLLIILSLSSLLMFISCDDENFEKFELVEIESTGVNLSAPRGLTYYGQIGNFGGEITLTAIGKNASNGFISSIHVGNFSYNVTDADMKQPLPYTICDEDWGKIEIVSRTPQITRLVLNENQTNNNIEYNLRFGGAYTVSQVVITQLSK